MLFARITGFNGSAVKHFRIGITGIESRSWLFYRHPALCHKYLPARHFLIPLCLILGKFIRGNQPFRIQLVIEFQRLQVFRLELDIQEIPLFVLLLCPELLCHIYRIYTR